MTRSTLNMTFEAVDRLPFSTPCRIAAFHTGNNGTVGSLVTEPTPACSLRWPPTCTRQLAVFEPHLSGIGELMAARSPRWAEQTAGFRHGWSATTAGATNQPVVSADSFIESNGRS